MGFTSTVLGIELKAVSQSVNHSINQSISIR